MDGEGFVGGALVALLVLVIGSAAVAQEVDARQEFMRGQTAYQQGDFERALEAWQRAYEADPRPLLLYNLSQAHERLGRVPEAIAALEQYLDRAAPDDEHQANARARLASLRERMASTGIMVVGAPEGATIVVDGEPHSRTPRPDPIRLSPGSHQIELRLEGYEDFQAVVVVPAGQTVEVRAEMVAGTGGGSSNMAAAPDEGGSSLLPFVLMGTGGAAILGGAVVGVLALGAAADAPSSMGDEADSARGLALVADVLFALGAAAAGTGLVLLLLEDGGTERAPGVAALEITPVVGPGSAGAFVGGRF